jgi:hypothetical protein
MRSRFLAICGLVALFGLVSVVAVFAQNPGVPAPINAKRPYASRVMKGRERHPELRQALRALMRARMLLNKAPHDFKGHRADAEKLTTQAIQQVREAMAVDRK